MQKFSSSVKSKTFVSLCLLAILTACGSITSIFPTFQTPTPTEPPGPEDWSQCKNSEDPNIYQPINSDSLSVYIYQNALLQSSTPLMFDPNKLPDARLGAYLRLASSVQHWTDAVDFPVYIGGYENHFVRLTLTFISPEIIEWVLLNQYLGEVSLSKDEFIERVNARISEFEQRKEIVFLVTFTSSYRNPSITDPNAIQINANVSEIKIFETNGRLIPNIYADPVIGQACCISRGALSGYIEYPMFVHRNKKCIATLDRENTTKMTIQVGKIAINDNEYPPVILTLRYHSLLDSGNPQAPDPIPIPDNKLIREPGMESNPPNPTSGADNENALYWQNMASYVWWYLVSP
jgi:hypothetical protein